MWILPVVGAVGFVLGFAFLTLAIASGLYYLSELVEEHTVLTKRLLTWLIHIVIVLQLLLYFLDNFPLWLSVLSIVSHVVYKRNLRQFPTVKLTDVWFLSSCFLVGMNHLLWFRHFSFWMSHPYSPPPSFSSRSDSYSLRGRTTTSVPSFNEVASYFGLCIWLVPFALFVSLSAGDNVLPSSEARYHGDYANGGSAGTGKPKKKGMARQAVDGVGQWLSETGELMGFWRGDRTKRF